jgi:hypothetical protein
VKKQERPFIVTMLCLLLVVFVGLYLARIWQALLKWSFLLELISFSPIYLLITGLFWVIVGLVVAVNLWLGKRRAPRLMLLFLALYSTYYWLEYMVLVDHSGLNSNWLFLALVNLVSVLWVLWVLSRPMTRIYYGENNERRP